LIICSPTAESQEGLHQFEITQVSLEYPNSAKTTTLDIEVVKGTLVLEPEAEAEEAVSISLNDAPFFAEPLPGAVDIYKTAKTSSWFFTIPESVDLNEDDEVTIKVDLAAARSFMEYEIST